MNGAILENYAVSEIRKSYLCCGKGAVLCMKPELTAIDRDNLVVPIRTIKGSVY